MSLKDKLEIGLKPDAPFRPDNLPDFQRDDEACGSRGNPATRPSFAGHEPNAAPVEKRRRRTRRPATGHRRMKGRR